MEDKLLDGEQPSIDTGYTTAVDIENGTSVSDTGSPYGKFKDAKSLFDAYNELQSEFTRKCQRLSQLEKETIDNAVNTAPTEETFSWQDSVNDFIKNHKHAKLYSKDITNELLKDESLKKDRSGLEVAYARVIESKFQPRDEIIQDRAFIDEYILNNEDIKKEIINNYINSVNRHVPTVLKDNGGGVSLTPKVRPTSLKEARRVVEDMLKN